VTDETTGDQRATFIVRLWRRTMKDEWQGQVEHVQTGERRGVTSVAAALAELRDRLLAPR